MKNVLTISEYRSELMKLLRILVTSISNILNINISWKIKMCLVTHRKIVNYIFTFFDHFQNLSQKRRDREIFFIDSLNHLDLIGVMIKIKVWYTIYYKIWSSNLKHPLTVQTEICNATLFRRADFRGHFSYSNSHAFNFRVTHCFLLIISLVSYRTRTFKVFNLPPNWIYRRPWAITVNIKMSTKTIFGSSIAPGLEKRFHGKNSLLISPLYHDF